MTMKSIYSTRIQASLTAGDEAVAISLIDLDVRTVTVSVDEFVKEVMALEIPGLTYAAPLPTEPGLYILKRDMECLENGPWTFRLSSGGMWHHLNGTQSYTEEEMRSKLPLVRLIVKED